MRLFRVPCHFVHVTLTTSLPLPSSRAYASTIPRPFSARYNPYTQCIEVLDSKQQVLKLTSDIHQDMMTLQDAIEKLK